MFGLCAPWDAVCGSSVDVLALIDDGNNSCTYSLITAFGPASGPCSSLFDGCDGYAGSLELYATNPANLPNSAYKDPAFDAYLDLMGLGSITFLGGALRKPCPLPQKPYPRSLTFGGALKALPF